MPTSELPSGGILRVRVTDSFLLDGGAWNLTEDQKGQPLARITPPATPMFQQVVAYLEAKPVPPGGNMRRADEARAAVAVCLRWGSYFAVLADPARPDAPDIADVLHAWRNGPVENVHAGFATGYGLGERRVLPKAEKSIVRQAQSGFSTGLKVVDCLRYDNAWPPPAERVLPFLHGLVGPSRWSHTELSRPVELPLRRDDQAGP